MASSFIRIIRVTLVTLGVTALCMVLYPHLALANLAMIYLLGVTFSAVFFGKGEAIGTSVLSVLAMDFFFVPPRFSFAVAGFEFIVTFIVMIVVGVIISNLAARVKEQAVLVRDREHAVAVERMQNALLSSISHDFRTPLATITGAAAAVIERGDFTDESQRELLILIKEQSERLGRIVRNVLDITKLGGEFLTIKREWQSVEELIGVALEYCSGVLKNRDVKVELSENLPLINVDEVLFEQLVVNILENASRYTKEGSHIVIRGRNHNQKVILEIEDDGPGIKKGEEEKIFLKLHRSDAHGESGLGLGLAICRSIVAAHDGTIKAGRGALGGALFHIEIPQPRGEEAV